MEKPLVSVIIPAYNAEKYIEGVVRSVLGQTYKNFEALVTDDGSTDGTADILKKLAQEDSRVKYIYQDNAGQSAARNTSIKQAKGQYIAFLDSDDYFLPEKLEKQVSYLEANPDCGLCYCKINHFFDDNREELYSLRLNHPSGHIFEELLRSNFINPLTVILRKEILDKFGAFEDSFRRVDEQFLWLKLSFNGVKFCYLDEVLGHYRIHRGSLSNDAQYFFETEGKYLELLDMMEHNWGDNMRKYDLGPIRARAKKRLRIGKLMMGKNPFAKLLLHLYHKRRDKKLIKIK